MDACYCWLCLGVDCLGVRFSLSSGSFPHDLHLELGSEGLSNGRMGPWAAEAGVFSVDERQNLADASCLASRGFGSE